MLEAAELGYLTHGRFRSVPVVDILDDLLRDVRSGVSFGA
jgi:hypothetical protein